MVLPSTTYSDLVTEHLADANTYEQVDELPDTQQHFLDAIGEDLHHLHPRVQCRLRQPGERVPNFYGLLKLHKTPLKIRPIVSSVDSQTYYWSKWVHAELWPTVRKNPNMLVNSADLAVRLADVNWETDHMCFLNLDVVALYTSIDHGQGIQAMMTFLRGDLVHPTLPDYPGRDWMSIVREMCLLLTCNFFTWNGTLYHQLRGTAMGSPAAVVYANIFMFQVEKSHLANLIASSKLYVRFIGDLLFIMDDLEPATRVAENLNASNRRPRVRWTSSVSRAHCVMLDLAITPDDDCLTTRLHFAIGLRSQLLKSTLHKTWRPSLNGFDLPSLQSYFVTAYFMPFSSACCCIFCLYFCSLKAFQLYFDFSSTDPICLLESLLLECVWL